jgi:hypothetical protein
MDPAIDRIKREQITDKFEMLRILMERAERLSTDGPTKKQMTMEAYVHLVSSDKRYQQTYSMIPLATIELIIEALIYASKTAVAVNKKTGCITALKGLFTRSSA